MAVEGTLLLLEVVESLFDEVEGVLVVDMFVVGGGLSLIVIGSGWCGGKSDDESVW